MAKKKSNAQKIGSFVANEMLGIDDAKRAFNKAKKGNIKGAIKSAATAAFEAGTTATGIGIGAKVGGKIGLTAGKAAARKTSKKVGQKAGQKMAEKLPRPKYPSGESKIKNIKADKVQTTSRSGAKSTTPNAKSTTVVTPKKTETQRLGSYKSQVTRRNNIINKTADSARQASLSTSKKPAVSRELGAGAGAAAVAPSQAVARNNNKKKKK
jgi:hypothetical protein